MTDVYELHREGRSIGEQTKYLLEQDHMIGKPLGACFESARWGAPQTVMYEMSIPEVVGFVVNWVGQNGRDFPNLLDDPRPFAKYEEVTLPFIAHSNCPRDKKHSRKIYDRSGLLHCAHVIKRKHEISDPCYDVISELNINGEIIREEFRIKFNGRNDLFDSELYGFLFFLDYGGEIKSIATVPHSELESNEAKTLSTEVIENKENIIGIRIVPEIGEGNKIIVCNGNDKSISGGLEEC